MPLLTVSNIRHQYATHVVLDGATLSVETGEKLGLVGRNGCGKTTLMRVVLGQLQPDEGTRQLTRGARVGYLSQDPDLDPNDTVRDAAEGAFETLHALHVKINETYDAMATASGDELDRLLKTQARIDGEIEAAGGYAIDHKIDAMLHGLGFTDAQFTIRVGDLSGGQKGRLGLARLLLEAPDLLLLDEPTNHLDIDGRRWLETFLADDYAGAVLVVSHDRWLLDRVAERIVEVDQGVIRTYPGNYHKYVTLRQERQLTKARVHEKQLDRIRQEEQFIARYKTGQRAKQARGRQSRLERYKRDELVERPLEMDVMRLKLPKASRSGDMVFAADGVSKSYGDLTLFRDLELSVGRAERIGIIGPNGVGKTTLIRVLAGELESDTGSVRTGSRLSIGYYRQLHENVDQSLTVWQYLQSVIVSLDGQTKASEQQARDLAGAFLFSGAEQDKALASVSGGERSRAVLAGLVAGAHNVLVLDEPSNHLDIPSAERLEAALGVEGGYDGTLIMISHDRALLEATCDRLVIFDGTGSVRLFPGRYSEWQRRQDEDDAPPPEAAPAPAMRRPTRQATPAKSSAKNKKKSNPLSRLSVSELEQQIEEIEQRISAIDRSLLDPDVYGDGVRCKELSNEREAMTSRLAPLEKEWASRAGGST